MLALLAAVALAAEPVATVNGVPITAEDLDATRASLPERYQDGSYDAQILEQLIDTQLLVEAAAAAHTADTAEAKARILAAQRNALAGYELERVARERSGEAEVQRWYTEHDVQFAVEQARARHILVKTEAEAQAILGQLKKGASFAELAKAQSIDTGSGAEGGELGWFARNRMVTEFATAVFSAAPGAIVGPVQTQFGWHVIEVEARRERVPLDEVREQVREQLQQEQAEAYLAELRGRATVTTSLPAPGATLTPVAVAPTAPKDAPRAGKGTKATLVVFLDAQCPHCARMEPELAALAAARKDLTVVFRHYPLSAECNPAVEGARHESACLAAKAVICAGKQGASLLGKLMENSAALDAEVITNAATSVGLSGSKYATCLTSTTTAARLALDVDEARALDIQGTPTMYLGIGKDWWEFRGTAAELGAELDKR